MKKLVLAIFGALSILTKKLKFQPTDKDTFIKNLTKGSIIFTRKRNRPLFEIGIIQWLKGLFGRGIQIVTNSYWSHTTMYLGKINGKHLIMEALMTVEINDLNKYLTDEYQLKAWSRPLTQKQQKHLVNESKKWVGKQYDILEIVYQLFGTSHPSDKVVCSSLIKKIYEVIEILNGKNPTPGDLDRYCNKKKYWSFKKFGW